MVCPLCGSQPRAEESLPSEFVVCTGCCEILRPDELVKPSRWRRLRRRFA